jgi:hypothetical protein
MKPLILDYLKNNQKLRALDIKLDNSVDIEFLSQLLEVLSRKDHLFYLVLQGIELQESADLVAKLVSSTTTLLYLSLNVRLYDYDFSNIAKAFRVNRSIRSLWLGCWMITGSHLQQFADSLKFNTSLTTFSILNSRKDYSVIEPLKVMFRYATTLESIILDRSNEEMQGDRPDYYSLLPILSKNQCIQNIDYYLYDGEASNDFYQLIQRNRNVQRIWDKQMRKVLLFRCKVLLLESQLPKEILHTILQYDLLLPFCSISNHLHKLSNTLMDRSKLGSLACPYRFSALEVLRRCFNLENRNHVEIAKTIQSPYLPLFFPRLLDPYYYPDEDQRKLRAGF